MSWSIQFWFPNIATYHSWSSGITMKKLHTLEENSAVKSLIAKCVICRHQIGGMFNVSGKIHCCLLIGKSRVTPKKNVTIPRLELVAAVLSVKIAALIRRELDIEWKNETFWTDSKVVLGYINNNTKKFKIFVANWIQQIHEGSNVSQWRYVPSKMNPADDASRRLDANPLIGLKDQIFFGTMKLLGQQKEQKPSLMKIQK